MPKSAVSLALLVIICMLPAMPAQAQLNRTFVSANGLDSNSCTFIAPCRSAQHAHDMTMAGGEINILDPVGYGLLTITKAISIRGRTARDLPRSAAVLL